MIRIAILVFEVVIAEPAVDIAPRTFTCDDGSPSVDQEGNPFWECEYHGCRFVDSSCWSERLNAPCTDEDGNVLDSCGEPEVEHCYSPFSCFGFLFSCEGKYECLAKTDTELCSHGTCTTNSASGPSTAWPSATRPTRDGLDPLLGCGVHMSCVQTRVYDPGEGSASPVVMRTRDNVPVEFAIAPDGHRRRSGNDVSCGLDHERSLPSTSGLVDSQVL